MTATHKTSLGFVVIGRNEASRIVRCIRSIGSAAPVVYADSASSDGSAEAARAAGAHVVILDDRTPLGAARGRREGFDALLAAFPSTSLVQFIDGDCVLETGWLDAATSFLDTHPDVGVVCGRRREINPDTSLYNRMIDREWGTPIGEAQASGGDSMMRVAAVLEAGGFDGRMMAGEEPELASRMRALGWRVWRIDAPMTVHDANIRHLSQWLRRAERSGMGYVQAYTATRYTGTPLYARQLRSAFFWALVLPASCLLASALTSWKVLLLMPLIYLAQIGRMALRVAPVSLFGWKSAAVTMLAKFPETVGALKVWFKPVSARSVEYKGHAE